MEAVMEPIKLHEIFVQVLFKGLLKLAQRRIILLQ